MAHALTWALMKDGCEGQEIKQSEANAEEMQLT